MTDGGRSLSVARAETFAYALRLNDLGSQPAGPVRAVADLDDRERRVVEAALSDGYETDDPSAWLQQFVGGTPFVERDGAFYRLDHALPTYTVTAEAVTESEVDGSIADREAYREAVTHDGRVTSGLLRVAREEGYRLTYVWPSLREFVDEYDAVRYRGELLAVSLTVDDPGPPYAVTAERAALADVARGPVWDASNASADLRAVVEAAGSTPGVYSADELPDGLLDELDANEYVYLDGTFYTTYVEKRDPLPVSLSARFEDDSLDGDGARLRLALRNEADAPVRVMSGAPRPFGVLRFHPVDESEPRRLLWTDAYAESGHVHTDGREVKMVNSIGLRTEVEAGGEAARTFTVEGDLPSGEYVVEGDVGVDLADDDGGRLPYRVAFAVP